MQVSKIGKFLIFWHHIIISIRTLKRVCKKLFLLRKELNGVGGNFGGQIAGESGCEGTQAVQVPFCYLVSCKISLVTTLFSLWLCDTWFKWWNLALARKNSWIKSKNVKIADSQSWWTAKKKQLTHHTDSSFSKRWYLLSSVVYTRQQHYYKIEQLLHLCLCVYVCNMAKLIKTLFIHTHFWSTLR